MPGIFPAELVGSFISNAERHGCRVSFPDHQKHSCMQQADLLLKLDRAERRDGLEMAMKRRNAQHRHFGKRFYPQGFCEIFADLLNGHTDARKRGVGSGDVAKHPAQRPLQHAKQEFPLISRRKHCDRTAAP